MIGKKVGFSNKEAQQGVISFEPLGMESQIEACERFLGHKGIRSGIATQDTILGLLKVWNEHQG